ncbi:16S rRNA (cytidine(1402)-2'-O)-methyltransferase [Candidatus Uhrbacteria bacterium]|nr:16S rRNA (cytidine(1402)-2'-O)-methyltransferase [Candidatus Uhrbacteria bacterium]
MPFYVVATPIGNLSDLSERAKETLASVDVVLCEDTRVSSKLLAHLNLSKTLFTYHQHSDAHVAGRILEGLKEGKNYALVTDAGTPGISDPGGRLVALITEKLPEVVIIPIPGPCAAIVALSVSGFPTDRFRFLGFPPVKKGRAGYFNDIAETKETVVFYESTHRIEKTMRELGAFAPGRSLLVARELTKLHETLYRGSVEVILENLEKTSKKGEFVVVVGPK